MNIGQASNLDQASNLSVVDVDKLMKSVLLETQMALERSRSMNDQLHEIEKTQKIEIYVTSELDEVDFDKHDELSE